MWRRASGFTFVELMIVMVIALLVAGLTLPRLRGAVSRSKLTTAARDVTALLRLARDVAVMNERACEVRFSPDEDQYRLVVFDKDGEPLDPKWHGNLMRASESRDDGDLKISNEWLSVQRLPSHVHFQSIHAAATLSGDNLPRVVFYPDGSTSPATIAMENDDKDALRVEIYRMTGMTRVEAGLPPDDDVQARKQYYGPGE